jgi:hypothetical protein
MDGKQVDIVAPGQAEALVLSLALPGGALPGADSAQPKPAPPLVLVRTKHGFKLTAAAEKPAGAVLARGLAEPGEHTAAALCLSDGDMLTLFEVSGHPAPASWTALMNRTGCVERMFFDAALRVVPAGSEPDPRDLPVTVALSKHASLGARRIFEDTPILPESKWGIPQAQRVPYVPNPTEASE